MTPVLGPVDPQVHACPDGATCRDPECLAENERRRSDGANHHLAAGKLCTDGADGFCTTCGVAMTTCDVCAGIGYHAKGCPESDESDE